jgi:hypothetical protein
LNLDRRAGTLEGLEICVGDEELDALDARLDHAIDGVPAAAPDADDLDARARDGRVVIDENVDPARRTAFRCHILQFPLSFRSSDRPEGVVRLSWAVRAAVINMLRTTSCAGWRGSIQHLLRKYHQNDCEI